MAPKTFMFIICFALTTSHTAEHSYGRQPDSEVAKVKRLSPPGLGHECMPPCRSHLYNNSQKVRREPQKNTKANVVKEETTQNGLGIATINVASWSAKIITMVGTVSKEFDILLIQEHHKIRKRDMKTGPYVIAGFAPAQRTIRSKSGRGWHTSGGVAILVRDNFYFEKDKHIPQQGLNWTAVKNQTAQKTWANKKQR